MVGAMSRININNILIAFVVLFCALGPMLVAGCADSGNNGSAATALNNAVNDSTEVAQSPQSDEACNTITDEGISVEDPAPLAPVYQVSAALQSMTSDFYDSVNNPPTDQSKFGTCLTCASCV